MESGLIKKGTLQLMVLGIVAFGSHWITKVNYLNENEMSNQDNKGRVTGIGGVFFKTDDPVKLKEWYSQNLGLQTNEYGTLFEIGTPEGNEHKAYMQWSAFSSKSNYFEGELMINYRVDDIEALLVKLRASGVEVVDSVETYDYGKFVHIRDLEGNKVELWEPVDAVFAQFTEGAVTK